MGIWPCTACFSPRAAEPEDEAGETSSSISLTIPRVSWQRRKSYPSSITLLTDFGEAFTKPAGRKLSSLHPEFKYRWNDRSRVKRSVEG
jgi:hypothetical protein